MKFLKSRSIPGNGFDKKEKKLEDYDAYNMKTGEKLLYIILAASFIFAIAYVFYRNIPFSVLLSIAAIGYPKLKTEDIIKKRKYELNIQFKDMLYSLSSSLTVGKSMETAFKDCLKDLEILYPDSDAFIISEVNYIIRKIELNETLESALSDFASRAHIEDVENFADVVYTCKRTGGNLIEVIKNTSNIINDKIEIKQEIDTILAQRKLEHRILNVLPVILVLLLSITAKDYMEPVFKTMPGRMVMSLTAAMLAFAYFISKRIMDIKI
jgi:tight adherence protein B